MNSYAKIRRCSIWKEEEEEEEEEEGKEEEDELSEESFANINLFSSTSSSFYFHVSYAFPFSLLLPFLLLWAALPPGRPSPSLHKYITLEVL